MDKPAPMSRLLAALTGHRTDRPPFWLMRQAGRYLPEYRAVRERAGGFLDLCFTPELACEVTLQPLRRFGMDAAILFSDILVIPYALGQPLWFATGEGPRLEPLADGAAVAQLRSDAVMQPLAPVLETVARVRAAIAGEPGIASGTALIGFAGAPWTVATYMLEGGSSREFAVAKRWALGKPGDMEALMAVLEAATVAYLIGQVRAGAQALQLFDSWAGVLDDAAFERWCIAPTARIVSAVKAACPGIPIIGFPRGASVLLADYAATTGVDAVSLGTEIPPAWAARALQDRVTLQGNLDPVLVQLGGASMIDAARRIVQALGRGPFVFNLGHGVSQHTPPDHVAALADWLRAPDV